MTHDSAYYAYLGVPDPTKRIVDEAQRKQELRFFEVLRRNLPGQWTDDRTNQARQMLGIVYIAANKAGRGLSAATAKIMTREKKQVKAFHKAYGRNWRKALPTPHAQGDDEEWVPAPQSHPLHRLFSFVNPVNTLGNVLYQLSVQRSLTGSFIFTTRRDRMGNPVEMWPLLTALTYPQPGVSEQYPLGTWRANLWNYGYGSGLGSQFTILDGRDVFVHRKPHPFFGNTDGYSPLTAGGKELDTLQAISEARKSAMDNGSTPDGVLVVDGADQQQLDDALQRYRDRNAGSKNHRKIMGVATNGEGKSSFTNTNTSPKDMDFGNGWQQLSDFALQLFDIPPGVVNLKATTYSEMFASIKAMQTMCLAPEAKEAGEFFTKRVVNPTYGDDYRVQFDLPKIDDEEAMLKRIQVTPGPLYRVNEGRALLGLAPEEDGDVPVFEWQAMREGKVKEQFAPPPPPPGQMPGSGTLNPSGASGDVPRPENPDGAGSLPGAMTKAFPRTEALLQEMGV